VALERPAAVAGLDVLAGVTVTEHTPTTLKLVVDTSLCGVREVVDRLLDTLPIADLSITDPPLEQVIAEIYGAPHP
jgi:hypothetical protein